MKGNSVSNKECQYRYLIIHFQVVLNNCFLADWQPLLIAFKVTFWFCLALETSNLKMNL